MLSVEKVYDELYGMIEDLKKKIAALSGGDEVTITPALESGTKIADYTIGEDEGVLYAPAPYIPLDYSTSEQDTGVKWIDNSPIYQKTVEFGALPNATTKAVAHDITDFAQLIRFDCTAFDSTDGGFPVPFTSTAALAGQVTVWVDDTNITLGCGADRSGFDAYVTLYYTKTQPEPEAKKTRKK